MSKRVGPTKHNYRCSMPGFKDNMTFLQLVEGYSSKRAYAASINMLRKACKCPPGTPEGLTPFQILLRCGHKFVRER